MRKLLLVFVLPVLSFGANSQDIANPQVTVNGVIKSSPGSVSAQNSDRITQATGCSRSLLNDLSTMVQSGVLKEIQISASPNASFQGYASNQTLSLTEQLMSSLPEAKYSVLQSDQRVNVNQTAFVLSYLAYRLKTADSVLISNFSNPMAYSQANMRNIATSFLTGWNAMVECAIANNTDKNLTVGQIGELLYRARYRFALMLPQNHPLANKFFTQAGKIDLSQENIDAVAEVLRNSRVPDIK